MYLFFFFLLVFLFAALAFRNITLATILLFGLLPTYLLRTDFFSVPTTFLEIIFLLLFAVFLVQHDGLKKIKHLFQKTYQNKLLFYGIVLIFLSATINCFLSPNLSASLGTWKAYILEPLLFFFLVQDVLKTKSDQHHALVAFGISAIVIFLFAVFQFATGLGIPVPWDSERRITGFFPYPNAVGLFLGPAAVLGFFFLITKTKNIFSKNKIFWLSVFLFSIIGILLAQTEAALVAIPVSLFLVCLFMPKIRLFALPLAVLFGIIFLLLPQIHVPIVQKITLQDFSGQVRIKQWEETSLLLRDHFLFGSGLSGYPETLKNYRLYPEIEIFQYPHNVFLNIWTELGLLGLVGFFLLALFVFKTFLKEQKNKQDILLFALFAVFLEMFIHGLVDVPYFKNDLAMMTFGLLALFVLQMKDRDFVHFKPYA